MALRSIIDLTETQTTHLQLVQRRERLEYELVQKKNQDREMMIVLIFLLIILLTVVSFHIDYTDLDNQNFGGHRNHDHVRNGHINGTG